MKIAKITTEQTSTKINEPSFRALKLKTSAITSLKRSLPEDTVSLRKNLPENFDSKVNKYFGQPAGDGPYEASNADIAVAIGAIAIGLGLAFL